MYNLTRNNGPGPQVPAPTVADFVQRSMQQQFMSQPHNNNNYNNNNNAVYNNNNVNSSANNFKVAQPPSATTHDNPIVVDDLASPSRLSRVNSIGHPALLLVEELMGRLKESFAYYNSPNFYNASPIVKIEDESDNQNSSNRVGGGNNQNLQTSITALPPNVLNYDALSAMMSISDVAVSAQKFAGTARGQRGQVEGLTLEDIEKRSTRGADDAIPVSESNQLVGDDPSSGRPSTNTQQSQNPYANPTRGRGRVEATLNECQLAIDKIADLTFVENRMKEAHNSCQSSQQTTQSALGEVQNAINSAKNTVKGFNESVLAAVDAERAGVEQLVANFQSSAQAQFEKIVHMRLEVKQRAFGDISRAYERLATVARSKIVELRDKQQRLTTIDDYDPSYEVVKRDCEAILTLLEVTKSDLGRFCKLAESLASAFSPNPSGAFSSNNNVSDIVALAVGIRDVMAAVDAAANHWQAYERDQAMSGLSDMFMGNQTAGTPSSTIPMPTHNTLQPSAPSPNSSAFRAVASDAQQGTEPIPSGRRNPLGTKRERSISRERGDRDAPPKHAEPTVIRVDQFSSGGNASPTRVNTTIVYPASQAMGIATTTANIAAVTGCSASSSHHNNAGWAGSGWTQHPQVVVGSTEGRTWGSSGGVPLPSSTPTVPFQAPPNPIANAPNALSAPIMNNTASNASDRQVFSIDEEPSGELKENKKAGGGVFSAISRFFTASSGAGAYVTDDEFEEEEGQFAPEPHDRHRRRAE